MPSQLFTNGKIEFLACKPFTYRGTPYAIGDDFPQEEANNIETLVRARYVIPVVDDLSAKPRHWHLHVKLRSETEELLANGKPVQIVFEDESTEEEDQARLEKLTHPEPEEPNQADHMAEVANARIVAEREAAEAEEPEETEPTAELEEDDTFTPNPEQIQFPDIEEPPEQEPADWVAESTVPPPDEQSEEDEQDQEEPGSAEDQPSSEAVPEGTIPEIKEWVGADPDRAAAALEAEEAGQNRTTLIAWLEEVQS